MNRLTSALPSASLPVGPRERERKTGHGASNRRRLVPPRSITRVGSIENLAKTQPETAASLRWLAFIHIERERGREEKGGSEGKRERGRTAARLWAKRLVSRRYRRDIENLSRLRSQVRRKRRSFCVSLPSLLLHPPVRSSRSRPARRLATRRLRNYTVANQLSLSLGRSERESSRRHERPCFLGFRSPHGRRATTSLGDFMDFRVV